MKTKKCRCRPPKTHRDCMYCGSGYMGEYICGVCKEAGIDGKLIPGTGRVVCKEHKKIPISVANRNNQRHGSSSSSLSSSSSGSSSSSSSSRVVQTLI